MEAFADINNLSSLLKESEKARESNEQESQPPIPGTSMVVKKGGQGVASAPPPAKDNKSIWDMDEVLSEDAVANVVDDRPSPRYEISYKQMVGTEDTFLGLADKTPSSSDCSHLVIKIHFPKATMKQLDLDVTQNRIKAESRTHKLFTYFPVPVDKDKGSAKFDTKKEVLTVTLPIIHEF